MGKNGAHILVETLIEEGVDVMFGYPGGSLIPVFDVLYDFTDKLKMILTRHEQGAAHAADGYARATGKVGCCIATSGPGALNLVTGIATANMDSIPLVAITGQVKTHLIGNDAFQEADLTGVTRPITKHNYLVKDVNDLGRIVREAFHIARTGRPGPVLIDVPVDVTTNEPDGEVDKTMRLPGYKPHSKGHPRQIRLAAEAINDAERPVLYVGGGVITSGASDELARLAEKTGIHVTTTLMGLGAFPAGHELNLGMLGMHGTPTANYAVTESDLIIAVGARFDDRVTGRLDAFAPGARVIHIDIDPTSRSKNIRVHIPVVGDAKGILAEMLPLVRQVPREAWRTQIAEWREKHPLSYDEGDGSGKLKPQHIIEQLCEAAPEDTIIATEVGQNQMWACQWYKCDRPRGFLSSGGLGTMGYGLPAAIGAKAGRPEACVIDIAGDGSIQMNIQELATATLYDLPVKVMILNNGYLGMVRQWQELFYDSRYSHTSLTGNPDFVKLAEAYGACGRRVTEREDVRPAIEEAISTDNTVLIDFIIEPEENVFPMVPAGEAINRMIGGMT